MGRRIHPLAVLLAGACLGALLGAALVAGHYNRMLDRNYVTAVREQVYLAYVLRERQMQPEALEHIEASLPAYARGLEQRMGREEALPALWALEEYYDTEGLAPPPELAGLFAELPPRPPTSCLRRPAPRREPAAASDPAP